MQLSNPSRIRDIKLVPIGNSKGVRLPKTLLKKYALEGSELVIEETPDGLLIRQREQTKLTWDETFRQTVQEKEDWGDFEEVVADGLDDA